MASNVVVIDSSARRATIKTTPSKYMNEVLQEACRKLGYNADNFGLKHKNRTVDLSQAFRLSGLVSGAKLELVQLSKSTGVVSVALQLPETEAQAVPTPNGRLTDKFPSNTTLWMLLRKFEAGIAGTPISMTRNFTQRSVPSGTSGAGRLLYEQPVLRVMDREVSSFTDLQKTLAQFGHNSGSVLIRLTFRPTQQPLEDAIQEIQAYFDSIEEGEGDVSARPTPAAESTPATAQANAGDGVQDDRPPDTTMTGTETSEIPATTASESTDPADPPPPNDAQPEPSLTTRPVSIYKPPTGTVPSSALTQDNESDFTPTVEHAQAHQKMLNEAGRNRRLKTDAELAAQAKEEAEILATIKEVEIKIRYPDQSYSVSKYGQADIGSTVYSTVRDEYLDPQFRNEPFTLRIPGAGAAGAGRKNIMIIPDNNKRLIQDLKLRGREMLQFAWDENAVSAEARAAKSVLRAELRATAQDLKAPEQPKGDVPEEKGIKVNIGKDDKDDEAESSGTGPKKMPKWLKFGKK
ncbi:Tether containing UBX domain for GLUT4 [Cyphellophora attinorum]|uniref:Tether containing UBX domain for GLUT4 n=1 Tax=Cyphellophora attinorum TaxID=1664694 RepID=A0A0N0NRY1_9EURO|nr:Tether containing UBX domain for GLUT4 [Phialophora attinorum]KPI45618.1 Tether containing UBX domain for GLUT4 [Phialophora attinorum]